MSAIAGIYYLDNRIVDRTDLERMVEILTHRGPDGSDIWCEGSVGLGHLMLWTTPESLIEQLPLANQTGNVVITADARIDNRDELITALSLTDRPTEKITDSQIILAAYEKWGENCPEKLLGDFAFAIWDRRKQIVFCARDHFGVKPFYYYLSERTFVFATEIKGILCFAEVPRRLNEIRVAEHLELVSTDATITFYQDILRLPPAHSMTVNPKETKLKLYWSLDSERELRLGSDEEYAKAFCEIFTEAVRCRLRSTLPIGSMLSGGLDSSSITCVARQLLSQKGDYKLQTFSTVHDEVSECDERFFQNAVVAQGGIDPHQLNLDQVSPLTDLDCVLWHQDEVQGLSNLYGNWCLYGSAKEQGVRVLLEGFDGDTTVSHGRGYLVELARAERWLTLAKEVIAISRNVGRPWQGALWAWAWLYGLKPIISKFRVLRLIQRICLVILRRGFRWRNPSTKRAESNTILNPEFVQRIGLSAYHQARSSQPKTERENHYRLLSNPGMQNSLEKLDSAAGAFSIELRYPFWDKRLVEFCLALPPEQKLHQGWNRMVMRRAMAGILPKEIQWRGSKTDHRLSFDRALIAFEQKRLEKVILNDPGVIEPYIDLNALREEYHRFISQEATEGNSVVIWRSVSLILWLQRTGLKP